MRHPDECPVCHRRFKVGLWAHVEACVRRAMERLKETSK